MTLVIYGPTVTGKTDLALKLAQKFNGELISADSRQVYKLLDIGTGKVGINSKVKKRSNVWIVDGVKIYGFDLVDPGENFSVSQFYKFGSDQIAAVHSENKLPIVVGGTGYYIKSLIKPFDSLGIPPNLTLRNKLEKFSKEDLFLHLKKINPKKAESLNNSDKNNPRRLIRAIEIAGFNKKPIGKKHLNYQMIGLSADNKYLYNRANIWLETRLRNGLIEEVENLIKKGISPKWLESLGLEYRWLTKHLTGEITYDTAISRLQGDIHGLIRRQKTFFLQFPQIKLFDIQKKGYQKEIFDLVKNYLGV